ncbi:hypothetical protein [Cellulomonas biazotea]|uniref:hypothetical protein n=1 Tax=Cellulomonas biazotea TaxID=1709 RepID=UPI0013EF025E|nr:hypothetical protein [Cellulomonas biazotea]
MTVRPPVRRPAVDPAPRAARATAVSRATRVVASLALVVGGLAVAVPAGAADEAPAPTTDRVLVAPGGAGRGVGVQATIENEEEFCSFLSDVYVYKPAYYSVRTINCRHSDVFVKGRYLNGTYGTCVLVPARHSRHLGGSVLKPMEDSQIC